MRLAFLLPVFLLTLVALITACGEPANIAAIEAQLKELRRQPQGKIEPLPDFLKSNAQKPNPSKLITTKNNQPPRDPFVPFAINVKSNPLAPNLKRPLGKLEQWDLEQLSFRGRMQRGEDIRALIITPNNQLVTALLGDRMGKNHGTIIHIDKESITLIELVPSGAKWHERQRIMDVSK